MQEELEILLTRMNGRGFRVKLSNSSNSFWTCSAWKETTNKTFYYKSANIYEAIKACHDKCMVLGV